MRGREWFIPSDQDAAEDAIVALEPQPVVSRAGSIPVLPVNRYRNGPDFVEKTTERKAAHFVSTDGSIFLPADDDFVKGVLYYGAKMADVLRAFALAPAVPGRPFYVCSEPEQKTYAFKVGPDGTLREPKLFAEKGGPGVTTDREGNVYIIAGGRIYVYEPSGTLARDHGSSGAPHRTGFRREGRADPVHRRPELAVRSSHPVCRRELTKGDGATGTEQSLAGWLSLLRQSGV